MKNTVLLMVFFILSELSHTIAGQTETSFRFETPDRGQPTFLSSFGISFQNIFSFQIKACADAFVVLKTYPDLDIKVLLGGTGNTVAAIRFNNGNKVQYNGAILDCDIYKGFWISWYFNVIRVGDNSITLLRWTIPANFDVIDIGFFTAWGQRGNWELYSTTGGWGSWYQNGDCSVTCGRGIQKYKRDCNNPLAGNYVTNCVGSNEENRECENEGCHGGWGNWTEFGVCSTTCGSGEQLYHRKCNNPVPGDMGNNCQGDSYEYRHCFLGGCPGNWGPWASQACSVSCGSGSQLKIRNCDNPPPSDGGHVCSGDNTTTVICTLEDCPASKWSYFKDLNITREEMKEVMKEELTEMRAKLTVNPKNTTSSIRRRISARDDRLSATTFGYAGAILLAIPIMFLVFSDCLRLCQKSKKI